MSVRRPLLAFTIVLSLAAILMVASWGLSFSWPHAMPLPGDYGVRCERGTVQLRRQTQTRLVSDATGRPAIVPVRLLPAGPGPERGGPNGAVLLLSPWSAYSTASLVSGGSAFFLDGTRVDFGYRLEAWAVAHWVLAAPLVLLASWRVAAKWRRRPGSGLCASCGYDLRATPDRCPECGAVSTQ
jgi:hypothetical protein